jgi:DNA-binding protein HU-beta
MERINKAILVNKIAEETGVTKKEIREVLETTVSTIRDALAEGGKVQLIGFGTFEVRKRAARKGRNPQTGQEITIPATVVPAFKPSKELKNAVK